jgi:hypothetical protein
MDKRLQKRHKRQVARARERVRVSEPDLRTPEQLRAAREASQPAGGWRNRARALYSKLSTPNPSGPADPAADSTAKGEGE